MKIIDYIVVDYCVVDDASQFAFESNVRKLIDEGWQPFGGISTSHEDVVGIKGKVAFYRQAMVKYDYSFIENK